MCENLASAVNGITPNLRELELSGDILKMSLCSVLSVGLRQPKLETLRSVADIHVLKQKHQNLSD